MCGMATLNWQLLRSVGKKRLLGVTLVVRAPWGRHTSVNMCDITRTRPYFVFCWKGNWSVLCFSTRPQRDLSRQVDVIQHHLQPKAVLLLF